MSVLHDAAGGRFRITITQENAIRYLFLDGCEEGAMALDTEDPVFHYLWFHRASRWTPAVSRALILGAGAFTLPKCVALDYPDAIVDAVDIEPALGDLARQHFRLDQPEYARVHFHACCAEDFLASAQGPYDFIFDDLFQGFQHVPPGVRGTSHIAQLRAALTSTGLCLKNLIWDSRSPDTRQACEASEDAWAHCFEQHFVIRLGEEPRGHNRLLVGAISGRLSWPALRPRLAGAGVPESILNLVQE